MPKSSRAYRSEKRGKELARIKKREEKRLRRQGKGPAPAEGAGTEAGQAPEGPSSNDNGDAPPKTPEI